MKRSWEQDFQELLIKWNGRINLIGKADQATLQERHLKESLQLLPLIPAWVDRGIDLGSGAGFPGLILAKASGLPFDLIEADARKAAFLREAARIMEAPVQVHATRIETARLPPAFLVTARALAPLPRLLRLAFPLLAKGGVCLFPKGPSYEAELTDSASEWQMQVERFPDRLTPSRVILRITELQRARSET